MDAKLAVRRPSLSVGLIPRDTALWLHAWRLAKRKFEIYVPIAAMSALDETIAHRYTSIGVIASRIESDVRHNALLTNRPSSWLKPARRSRKRNSFIQNLARLDRRPDEEVRISVFVTQSRRPSKIRRWIDDSRLTQRFRFCDCFYPSWRSRS